MTVFSGAGISVEAPSNIPDFRSPGGLWERYDPFVYCEYNTFLQRPHLFWEMATQLTKEIHLETGAVNRISKKGGVD
jgi:NAD-dependent deacetylase